MRRKPILKVALAIAMALAAAGCASNDAAPSPSAAEASAEEASAAPAMTQESVPDLEPLADASSEPEAEAAAEEAPVAGGTESQQASWSGVYVCHEGVGDGWVYLIEGENESRSSRPRIGPTSTPSIGMRSRWGSIPMRPRRTPSSRASRPRWIPAPTSSIRGIGRANSLRMRKAGMQPALQIRGAGDGNRTRVVSLEG